MKYNYTILYVGQYSTNFPVPADKHNVQLTVVNNGLQALLSLKSKQKIDVIVCENNLPGESGMRLFDMLQMDEDLQSIPFILLSETFDQNLYKQAFEKGIDDFYVLKDISSDEIYERIFTLVQLHSLNGSSHLASSQILKYKMPISKRLFDIGVASTALLIASPLMIIVMVAIRLESKGRVYFTSKRVGRKTFDFYKFRSMRSGAADQLKELAKKNNQYGPATKDDAINFNEPCPRCSQLNNGDSCSPIMYIGAHKICDYWYNEQKHAIEKKKSPFIKIKDDPRVTRIGKIIRNTSIDELPQLINVLKGDMSIVGNRPLPVYEAECLTVGSLSKRFLAPAGITGLWQVELRGRGGEMSEDERKKLDNEYADHFKDGNYSFWYDLKLILRTIPALLQKSNV